MDKDGSAAVVGLDEAKPFFLAEKFYGSGPRALSCGHLRSDRLGEGAGREGARPVEPDLKGAVVTLKDDRRQL